MEAVNAAVVARWGESVVQWVRDWHGGTLPAEIEADLAAFPIGDSPRGNALRFARAYHWYWQLYSRATESDHLSSEESQLAARELLTRHPVMTVLAGRSVAVTGRSYNALAQIAAHSLRIRELEDVVPTIERMHGDTLARYRGFIARRRVRARLAQLRRMHAQVLTELLLHRRALYAHALTRDGAAATDVVHDHPAPWWQETTAEDDARLLLALFEAGPGRYQRLRRSEGKGESTFVEDYGFHSLLSWIEGDRKLEPASLYDQDVGQILASVRAGVIAMPESERRR